MSARAPDLRNYAVVTGAYWADTIADGAIRVLVLFYFYELGYSPFEVASLFLFYEVFGIVTNLVGGWIAARFGLRATLLMGLGTQLVALGMLGLAPESWLVVAYVMVAQALSGIAKDLTKMSSKSAVKLVVPEDAPGTLYRWVAILTGSKNALKGVGFFLGGLLLGTVGFQTALLLLAGLVGAALVLVLALMRGELGRPDAKARFRQMFSNDRAVNVLAGRARLPVRLARRLVRRRPARLPAHGARLELLAGGHVPRRVGDRLRHRPGDGAAASCAHGGAGTSPTARRRPGSRSCSRRSPPGSPWRSRRASTRPRSWSAG